MARPQRSAGLTAVVPAKAGTHNHRCLLGRRQLAACPNEGPRRMGPCSGPGRQVDGFSSSLRTQGPITTGLCWEERQLAACLNRGRGVWVPAFAGTTVLAAGVGGGVAEA